MQEQSLNSGYGNVSSEAKRKAEEQTFLASVPEIHGLYKDEVNMSRTAWGYTICVSLRGTTASSL